MSVEEHAHTDSTPPAGSPTSGLVWLAGLVFLSSLVGLVLLEALGRPTANLTSLVTPVIAALLLGGHVSNVTRQQNVAINKIERQTNGVLDERIRTQVHRALTEAAPIPAAVVSVVPVDELPAAVPPAPGEPPSEGTMPATFLSDARGPETP